MWGRVSQVSILLNSVFYNSTNSSYYGSWQHLLPYHMLSGIWVVKLHANSSSLPLSVFRSFFHYFYMYDVREIVWWRSLQKDKIILSTTQPLDYLAVRHKCQQTLKRKRAEENWIYAYLFDIRAFSTHVWSSNYHTTIIIYLKISETTVIILWR